MDMWQALFLGLIEGITEYLPVSSTGHLLVAQRLMGIEPTQAANAYAIAIQAGAIVAVLGLYRGRVAQMALGLTGRHPSGLRLALCVAAAFLPAAVLGLAFDDAIEAYLFGPIPIIFAWVVGGIIILTIGKRLEQRGAASVEQLTLRAAVIIGFAQCIAMWPGTSRSLATIFGGMAVGLSLPAAVEFSFLLGVLTLGAATAYKALQHGSAMLESFGPGPLVVGFIAAWVSAVFAVRWMIRWLSQRGLGVFGWWRIGLGAAVASALLAGWL